MKKTLCAILTGVMLNSAPATAENEWGNIQNSWNTLTNRPSIRIEGNTEGKNLGLYGFFDTEGDSKRVTQYGEFNLNYKLSSDFLLTAELNVGTGMNGTTRFGLGYTPKLGRDNYTLIKFLPANVGGTSDSQISLYTTQKIGRDFGINFLVDHSLTNNSNYIEAGCELNILEEMQLFAQLRGQDKLAPFVGVKYNF